MGNRLNDTYINDNITLSLFTDTQRLSVICFIPKALFYVHVGRESWNNCLSLRRYQRHTDPPIMVKCCYL